MEASLSNEERFFKYFNPKEYYNMYLAAGKGIFLKEWIPFALKNLHEIFSSGEVCGDTLMDMGAGISIYHLLSACEVFKNIITSDLMEKNYVEIKKWLRKEPDMLNWSEIIKAVCDLEGNSEKCEEKEEKLRRAVKSVLKGDVVKKNPFEPLVLPPADCVLCCLCLEAPCKDLATFCDTIKNLKNFIKPGGHIIILSGTNATYFFIGEKKFPVLSVTNKDIEKAFTEGGYEILKLELKQREDLSFLSTCDFQGLYCVLARKPDNA